jgi:hypothetical protein
MVMELAGKYKNLKAWAETPEATGGQYPTIRQELNRNLHVLKNAQPGSQEAVQAMINVNELQNAIADINAANDRYLQRRVG